MKSKVVSATKKPAAPKAKSGIKRPATSKPAKAVKKPATKVAKAPTARPAKKARTTAPAKTAGKTSKAKPTIRRALTSEREREIRMAVVKMKKTPELSFRFIAQKWKEQLRTKKRVEEIPKFLLALTDHMTKALAGADEAKQAKIRANHKRKTDKLNEIAKAFNENPLSLKYDQLLLLSKMRVGKQMSSYMRYAKSVRPAIQAANPNADFGQIGKLIGDQWRALTDAEKAKFNTSPKPAKPTKGDSSSSSATTTTTEPVAPPAAAPMDTATEPAAPPAVAAA